MGTDISSLSLHHHGSPSCPPRRAGEGEGQEGRQSKKLMIGLDRACPGSSAARAGMCGKLPKETPSLAFHRFLCPLCASIRIGTTPNTVDSLDLFAIQFVGRWWISRPLPLVTRPVESPPAPRRGTHGLVNSLLGLAKLQSS